MSALLLARDALPTLVRRIDHGLGDCNGWRPENALMDRPVKSQTRVASRSAPARLLACQQAPAAAGQELAGDAWSKRFAGPDDHIGGPHVGAREQ